MRKHLVAVTLVLAICTGTSSAQIDTIFLSNRYPLQHGLFDTCDCTFIVYINSKIDSSRVSRISYPSESISISRYSTYKVFCHSRKTGATLFKDHYIAGDGFHTLPMFDNILENNDTLIINVESYCKMAMAGSNVDLAQYRYHLVINGVLPISVSINIESGREIHGK